MFFHIQTGGGVFLMNDGLGYYGLFDSIFFDHGFPVIHGDYFDDNNYIDIFNRHQSSNPHKENIVIIYNYGITQFDSIKVFFLYDNSVVIDDYSSGDIDNDGDNDIVFSCNNDFLWGIIYNNGTGNFSTPEYFDLSYPPMDIACTDLNDDGRADVVVCGSDTEIYFSTETGFQQMVLTNTLSHDVLISDFDNDGDNDVITHTTFVYPNHRVYMFKNLGNNQFYEHPYFEFSPFCSYSQIADFNNDSLPDMVFIASDHSSLYIYQNKGDFQLEYQQFIPHENLTLGGLFCEDYDNNDFIDIAFTSGFGQIDYYLNILFNDGQGNFQEDPITNIEFQKSKTQIPNMNCYPNPFQKFTNVDFLVKGKNKIEITLFDINGKEIKTLTNKIYSSGNYKLMWNGTDKNRKEVKLGTYLIRLKTGSHSITKRVIKIN